MQIEDNGRLVHTYQIAEGDVTAVVMRQNRKTIGVGLTNDGMPCLSIPRQMTIPELRRFLQDHRRMIRNMEERQRRKEEAFQEARKNRLTQEDIDRLGKAMCQDLPPRLKKYAQIIGVNYSRVTVRNQRTRWGSCSSRGSLNFNCLLMLAPEKCRDYVVVHELCHRKHMDHSPAFWAEVERAMPDYREWRDWLKEHESEIMMRME